MNIRNILSNRIFQFIFSLIITSVGVGVYFALRPSHDKPNSFDNSISLKTDSALTLDELRAVNPGDIKTQDDINDKLKVWSLDGFENRYLLGQINGGPSTALTDIKYSPGSGPNFPVISFKAPGCGPRTSFTIRPKDFGGHAIDPLAIIYKNS